MFDVFDNGVLCVIVCKFVINNRPLKHHHNELYSIISNIEMFRNVFHLLDVSFILKIISRSRLQFFV